MSTDAAVKPTPAGATRPDSGTEDPYTTPVVQRAQPRELAAFALLRTRPEGLPPATRGILRRPVFGINWKLAQRIPIRSKGSYWLLPGDDHLCIVSQGVMHGPGVGTTCATASQAIAHGLADISITLPGPAHRVRVIVGVAPAGARAALVHTGAATATAPVRNGIFVLRDTTLAPPDSISLRR